MPAEVTHARAYSLFTHLLALIADVLASHDGLDVGLATGGVDALVLQTVQLLKRLLVPNCQHVMISQMRLCDFRHRSMATYSAPFQGRNVRLHLEQEDVGDIVDAGRSGRHCVGW